MDIDQVIAELREELDRVRHAIQALESLQVIRARREESEAALEGELGLRRTSRRKKPAIVDRVDASDQAS